MPTVYDIFYRLGLALTAPAWLLRPSWRRKVFKALSQRMGNVPTPDGSRPAVMIHAVSLGEINATRLLVGRLKALRPELQFIITTTTDTGFARGQQLYGGDSSVTLARYPLDFSSAIRRFLDAVRPSVVALMELEVWPNFIRHCQRRGIPVVLINGRLTAGSYRNYRLARLLVAPTFRRLIAVCAQDESYAERFRKLGARPERTSVTGTMKFDTAEVAERVEGDQQLAAEMGLRPGQGPIWVCGSTGPGEERIVLGAYRRLVGSFPSLRLAIIPRDPERFEEVASLIEQSGFDMIRRSNPQSQIVNRKSQIPILLGDTMGELRKFYSLASVVFVGRSLVDLGSRQHGSDMIEPAALGKAVIVGPFTANFAEAVACLRAGGGIAEVEDEAGLVEAVSALLKSPQRAAEMGRLAQAVVRQNQGATDRHSAVILQHLPVR